MVYKRSLKNTRVLITCGPTWVPIDSVRVISNISSGEIGQLIAEDCQKAGARVTLLLGPVTVRRSLSKIRIRTFQTFNDLKALLNEELRNSADVIIHAAAVSDYRVKRPKKGKIRSDKQTLSIELVRNPKLITGIKRNFKDCFLVGFKLIPSLSQHRIKKETAPLFEEAQCDLVVVNSVNKDLYHAVIMNRDRSINGSFTSKKEISKNLLKKIKERL